MWLAHVPRNDATMESVHKSRGNIFVCMCVQLSRCCVFFVLQRVQYGKCVCVFASTLCKYDLSKADIFVI